MQITVNSTTLATELRILNRIAATKSTIPVLTNILFRAEDQLYLSATDLEVAMTTTCPANIQQIGVMTLPAKKLLEMIEQLPDCDVSIELDKTAARVSAGAFKSRLQAIAATEFPALPTMSGDIATIANASLHLLIERTAYAISDKAQKYVMDGALLSLSGEVMAMVSTDGKRLSLTTASRSLGSNVSVIIPSKTLDILLSQESATDIEFSRSDRHLFFNYGRRLLISRMIDGEFPKYERIIPKDNDKVITVERLPFASALRRVGLVADDLSITFEPGVLSLTSSSAEIGDAAEQVPIAYDGPVLKVHVAWQFVLDFLDRASDRTITIKAKDAKSHLLLEDSHDFLNVVMLQN